MICQNCNKNNATTHVKSVVNGVYKELHLCSECAQKANYNFADGDIFKMFSLLQEAPQNKKIELKKCDCCGSTLADISKTGKVGCSKCYKVFSDELTPNLVRIHGSTSHVGKKPKDSLSISDDYDSAPLKQEKTPSVKELREQLKNAISTENYEKAAELRDIIRQMEGEK